MPNTTTNTTNTTTGSGGAAPPFSDGGGFPGSQGIEVARRQLNRIIDGLSGAAEGALNGLRKALGGLGGGGEQASGFLVDPESTAAAMEVVVNLW